MTTSRSERLIVLPFVVGLLLGGCAGNQYPTTPPDPHNPNLTWAERYYIQKMKYQQLTNDRLR
jgi:hypothetical protein